MAIAKGEKFDYQPRWGIDMQSEHERYLTEKVFGRPAAVAVQKDGSLLVADDVGDVIWRVTGAN